MKKRKFKQFFRENWGWFVFIIWCLLLLASIAIFKFEDIARWIKLSLVTFFVLYTISVFVIMCRLRKKDEKDEKTKNKRLQELKTQYQYYIDLVDRHVKETLIEFNIESLNVDIDTSLEYLISFSDKVNLICNTRGFVGKPDSFIIASCLMYSLISYPVIMIDKLDDDGYLEDIRSIINMCMAMHCVFEIISEPITYFEDGGIWVEEKHPKVNIVIPTGLIKNSNLYQRILNTIYRDELTNNRTSIMQFSNLLHLIYLNCQ